MKRRSTAIAVEPCIGAQSIDSMDGLSDNGFKLLVIEGTLALDFATEGKFKVDARSRGTRTRACACDIDLRCHQLQHASGA